MRYTTNHFRMGKIKDKILLTNEGGGWVLLNKEQYRRFLRHQTTPEEYAVLERQGIIITENNSQLIKNQYIKRHGQLLKGAGLFIIVDTLRCNQKCIYCHSAVKKVSEEKYDMNINTADKILEFVFQTPAKIVQIEFQGGEPTLNYPVIRYIVKKSKEMAKEKEKNLKLSLVSNLTNDPETVDWCAQNDVEICSSLDGPEDIHNKNRPGEKGEKTYETVIKEVKKRNMKNCLMVTTKHSINKAEEIIDEYIRKHMSAIQLKPLSQLGFASKGAGYSTEQFIGFWKKGLEKIIRENKKGNKIKERITEILLSKILTETDPSFLDIRSPCGLAIGQIAFNHNGDIYSCDEGRSDELFKLGNVYEDTYKSIFQKEKTKELIKATMLETYLCDNCAYKPYCGTCIVLNYAEENNLIPKLGTNNTCKIRKAQFKELFERLISKDPTILLEWAGANSMYLQDHIPQKKSTKTLIEERFQEVEWISSKLFTSKGKIYMILPRNTTAQKYQEKANSIEKINKELTTAQKITNNLLVENTIIFEMEKRPLQNSIIKTIKRFHEEVKKNKDLLMFEDRSQPGLTNQVILGKINQQTFYKNNIADFSNIEYGPLIKDLAELSKICEKEDILREYSDLLNEKDKEKLLETFK